MKNFLKALLVLSLLIPLAFSQANAQENIKLRKFVIGSGGMVGETNSENITMSGLVGQTAIEKKAATGLFEGKKLDLWQGFWVPDLITTDINDENPVAGSSIRNYPNPFSNSTTIEYDLPAPAQVTIRIYDVVGNVVRMLVNDYQNAGTHTIEFNGKSANGVDLSSGSYMYELIATPANLSGGDAFRQFNLKNVMVIVR